MPALPLSARRARRPRPGTRANRGRSPAPGAGPRRRAGRGPERAPRGAAWGLALALGVSAWAAAPALAQADAPRDRLLFRGLAADPDPAGGPPELWRFELLRADSSVVVTPLGRADVRTGPLGGFPELPAPPDSARPLRVPHGLLSMMADQVEGALADGPPEDRTAYSVEGGRLRVAFERGVPLAALGAFALGLVGLGAAAAAAVARGRSRRRRAREADARRRQIEATEAERVRAAREIHDGPLQDLHALRLRAAARGETDVETDAARLGRELRAIAEGLRPPALGRFGLAAALASHARRVEERHPGVRVRVRADEDAPAMAPDAEASLFRVAQEAVANAVRHGRARRVEVRLAAEPSPGAPEAVRLEVADDGRGLPAGHDPAALVAGGHFGLAGMAERAALLGGALTVGPPGGAVADAAGPGARPGGTVVRLVAPWPAADRDA